MVKRRARTTSKWSQRLAASKRDTRPKLRLTVPILSSQTWLTGDVSFYSCLPFSRVNLTADLCCRLLLRVFLLGVLFFWSFLARFVQVCSLFQMQRHLHETTTVGRPNIGTQTPHILPFMPSNPQLLSASPELDFRNYMIIIDVSHFRWVAARPLPDLTLQDKDVRLALRSHEVLKGAVITRAASAE